MGSISTKLIILPPPSCPAFESHCPAQPHNSVHELAEEHSLCDQQLVWHNVHGLLVARMNTQRPVLGLQWSSHGFTLPFVLREGEVGEGRRGWLGNKQVQWSTSRTMSWENVWVGKSSGASMLGSPLVRTRPFSCLPPSTTVLPRRTNTCIQGNQD